MYRIIFVLMLSTIGLMSLYGQPVGALSSDPKHFIGSDNTFYAYVKAGEDISAKFTRSQYSQEGNPADVFITMDGPDTKQQKCTLKRDMAIGKNCTLKAKNVAKSGIWKINLTPGKEARPFSTLPSDVRWVTSLYSWNISVSNKDGEQAGRIWTDRYSFRQPLGEEFTGDFAIHYVSEDGYIYKTINRDYNGQVSILLADSIGVRKGSECVSAYRSAEVSDRNLSPTLGKCGNRYKLFFQEPAGNLPTEAKGWDDKTDWVRPNIKQPSVNELHFSPDGSSDQLSGTISFFLRNFVGQYEIKVDVDNDGSFEGQHDVVLRQQMKSLSNGLQSVHFQGVDKGGQIITPSQPIGIRVDITKVAEIHFVAIDVEGRGGLEVTRLNGLNAPTSLLCWNDTDLSPISNTTFATAQTDGRSCPDSTNGVHGWGYSNRSWGDARYIDNWIYASVKLDSKSKNQIVYPEEKADEGEAAQQNLILPMIIGGGLIVIVGAVIAIVIKRRGRNKTPPPSDPGVGIIQPSQSQTPYKDQPPPLDDSRY